MNLRKISKKYFSLVFLLSLSLLVSWPLFLPGYFSHHDDLQVMRIFEMRKCLDDLQIPCRWVPDLGFGNGYPLFNYYNVFPYYIGALSSYFLSFLDSAKLIFFIPLALASISMYLLARELFGNLAALLSAALFSFAPYKALDIYVRGAVAEGFSISIIPLVLYFAIKLKKENLLKYRIGLILSLTAFLTSHNILVLLFLPVITMLLVIWYWDSKWIVVKPLLLCLLLGFGVSVFFIIPAFFEKNLVQIDNLIKLDMNFRGHFVSLRQLFLDRSWGFGASFPGENDTISFQIGWPHYLLVIGSVLCFPFIKLKDKRFFSLFLTLTLVFIISIFMTHSRSAFIWERIDILKFVQFPWRFLSITIFSASLLGGSIILHFHGIYKKIAVFSLIAVTVYLNFSYFKPEQFYFEMTDKEKLSGKLWETQQKAAILDYLPIGAVEIKEAAADKPKIKGGATIEYFHNSSNKWELKINAKTETEIIMPVLDFPNWKVFENKNVIVHSKDEIGRITYILQPGTHLISAKFTNTPIRTFSNIVTLISIILTVSLILGYGKIRKIFN